MHLKVFVKLNKKTLKTLSFGQKPKKKPKKQKNKKTHWAGFFLKKPGFFPTLTIEAWTGLALKNPPKKTQKTPPKKTH
jgi:hypothetical protein